MLFAALTLQSASAGASAWRPELATLDAYSRNIALALAVETRSGETALLSGAGGDLFLLRHRREPSPALELERREWPYTCSTGGVVLDIALERDCAYVAAFRDGLWAFDRGGAAKQPVHWSFPAGAKMQALTVASCDLGPRRFVAVGYESYGALRDGGVSVLEHDREHGALRECFHAQRGAIHAVALTAKNATPEAQLVLLAGSACSDAGGLQRFDLDARAAELVCKTNSNWSVPSAGGGAKATIVRDLLIDPERPVAYAAAFWDGVWAFDLAPEHGGLAPLAGWPLKLANAPDAGHGCHCEPRFEHCASVAHALGLTRELAPGVRHLWVAFGLPRTDVSCVQFLSDWNNFAPCNESAAPPEVHDCTDPNGRTPAIGVYAFELQRGGPSAEPVLAFDAAGAKGRVGATVLSLATANESADGYDLYTANVAFGLQTVRIQRAGESWRAKRELAWSGAPPARMPMPAFDDLAFAGGEHPALLAASEGSVAAFDLSLPQPLSRPNEGLEPWNAANPSAPWTTNEPAIQLARFDGPNARCIGTSRRGGLVVFDASDPRRPCAVGGRELDRGGFGYGLVAARGSASEAGARWLFCAQEERKSGWSVQWWDFGTDAEPRDPGEHGPQLVAALMDAAGPAREVAGLSVLEHGAERVVYALYAPAPGEDGSLDRAGEVGVVALATNSNEHRSLRAASPPVPAFADASSQCRGVRSTLDAEAKRLYVAWVGLLAVYDISEPLAPRVVARRDLRRESGAYGLVPAPVQIALGPRVDGRAYAYVALLNDGLWILDVTDAESFERGAIARYATPWQTTAVLVDPRDASRRRLFLAEGTRGLEWVELRTGSR